MVIRRSPGSISYNHLSCDDIFLQVFDDSLKIIEPAHEIMVLFILRKLILQTRMCSYPVGLVDA